MPSTPCELCHASRALIVRPKNQQRLCKLCFLDIFESEIHHTIAFHALFVPGEQVAIGASGGKDSTVLACVLKILNEKYNYGVELILLSIDEGIKGYRDDSLETVKRNALQYDMSLEILSYRELYGWTMDQVVESVGKKGNCTYCGVFRRQALDRGAAKLGVKHVVTGHNADDIAETVLMNLLRGDLPRLSRCTHIVTSTPTLDPSAKSSPSGMNIKRSKPLKYAYEKEIVLYAHHRKLDYFSTECIYSPEAFRGSARALIKDLERIRPSSILDIVRSGEDMRSLCPGEQDGRGQKNEKAAELEVHRGEEDDASAGCGSGGTGRDSGGQMAALERQLGETEKTQELETHVFSHRQPVNGQRRDRERATQTKASTTSRERSPRSTRPTWTAKAAQITNDDYSQGKRVKQTPKQTMGSCERCGYLSSQLVCKACKLLEGLNKNRPKTVIEVDCEAQGGMASLRMQIESVALGEG